MDSLNAESQLKQLVEETENLKRQNSEKDIHMNYLSQQNDFLEKTVQWFQTFLELAEEKDLKHSQLVESRAEDQFLFGDLVCNILDKGIINNENDRTKNMDHLIKPMDEIINDTETVFKFYNDIPIVQAYKAINSEHMETEKTLKNLEEQSPILKEDIEHLNLMYKERNQLIVEMATNSLNISNYTNEIDRITNDFNELLVNKNKLLKDLNNKIEELEKKKQENENINKVASKLTLSHIDIFKVPSFPTKIHKNLQNTSKPKLIDHKKCLTNNSKRSSLKIVPTFPILPLQRKSDERNAVNKLQKPIKYVQIIENIQIKPCEKLKSGNNCQEKCESTTTDIPKQLAAKVIQNYKVDSVASLPDNAATKKSNIIPDTEIEQNIIKQKSSEFNIKEKNKSSVIGDEQTTKNYDINITSVVDSKKSTNQQKLKYVDYKSINKPEILIEKNIDSEVQDICSAEKRYRADLGSLKNNKNDLIEDGNSDGPSICNKEIQKSEDSNKKNTESTTKDDILNLNIDFPDAISSNDDLLEVMSVKSAKECEEFNFDSEDMNFDMMVDNNDNNFFPGGGDLDFSSDNQFGASDCDSFKF